MRLSQPSAVRKRKKSAHLDLPLEEEKLMSSGIPPEQLMFMCEPFQVYYCKHV